MVNIRTTLFNKRNSPFCSHGVFTCFVWFLPLTHYFPKVTNHLVVLLETGCEVGTEVLCTFHLDTFHRFVRPHYSYLGSGSCFDQCVAVNVDGLTNLGPRKAIHRNPGLEWLVRETRLERDLPKLYSLDCVSFGSSGSCCLNICAYALQGVALLCFYWASCFV